MNSLRQNRENREDKEEGMLILGMDRALLGATLSLLHSLLASKKML